MFNLAAFRERVQELTRQSAPYDGKRATQRDLAAAIGLGPAELSKRLRGAKETHLTERDVRAIVRTLAEWGAIQTQPQASELLDLGGGPPFSTSDWQSPPLDLLTPHATPQTQTSNLKPQTSNLPHPLTSFIGRREEMLAVETLLGQTRLLTLSGAGGSGKTRLALEVATRLQDRFHDGVWLVELASLNRAELVAGAVAQVLGLRERSGQPISQTLREAISGREMMLLLDNCEHLITHVAQLAAQLLAACPGLRILATSRERLQIGGETIYQVPPLSLPPSNASPRRLLSYAAVRLFVERARAVQPDLAVTPANATALGQICTRLDGIPLALELAAARTRVLSLGEINARLDNRFALLTGGNSAALPRQQTLKALIDWSYDLLDEDERTLFRRLAVFVGSFDLAAVEAVCSDEYLHGYQAIDLLGQLVDKSLLLSITGAERQGYRMLETIREYAAHRLTRSHDERVIRQRHAAYYLELAEAASPQLQTSQQAEWLARLEQEHDNIRTALDWLLATGDRESGLRLATAVWRFWHMRGHWHEGRRWLDATLADSDDLDPTIRANALAGVGSMALVQGDYDEAQQRLEQALDLQQRLADKEGLARTLSNLGILSEYRGDYAAARLLYEQSLHYGREQGNKHIIANTLNNLSSVLVALNDYPAAKAVSEQGLALRRELDDKRGIAQSLGVLNEIAAHDKDSATAYQYLQEALSLAQSLDDSWVVGQLIGGLGNLALAQGNLPEARRHYRQKLASVWQLGDRLGVARTLETLARVELDTGAATLAAHLLAAADNLREAIGASLEPRDQADHDNLVTDLSTALGNADFAAAFARGSATPLQQIIGEQLLLQL